MHGYAEIIEEILEQHCEETKVETATKKTKKEKAVKNAKK